MVHVDQASAGFGQPRPQQPAFLGQSEWSGDGVAGCRRAHLGGGLKGGENLTRIPTRFHDAGGDEPTLVDDVEMPVPAFEATGTDPACLHHRGQHLRALDTEEGGFESISPLLGPFESTRVDVWLHARIDGSEQRPRIAAHHQVDLVRGLWCQGRERISTEMGSRIDQHRLQR